jgi:hypothetical protein
VNHFSDLSLGVDVWADAREAVVSETAKTTVFDTGAFEGAAA